MQWNSGTQCAGIGVFAQAHIPCHLCSTPSCAFGMLGTALVLFVKEMS